MSSEFSPGIDAQLLDDFFAEADEHLVEIRKELLRLESSIGKAEPDLQVVKKLFQDFHSFKGISAIVGLKPAELVAHAAEDFLRLMRDGRAQLTENGLGILTAATQKLEQTVASFRAQKPLPGCESLLADLNEQCKHWSGSGTPVSSSDASFLAVEEARSRGLLLWRFTFSPTKELDAQGVNVNSVREQLLQIGEILKASPIVKGKDSLIFEFLVSTRETPANLPSWEAKGVTVEPVEAEQTELSRTPREAASSGETEHNPFLAPSHIVRVDLKRLDDLMRITGEMVIHRSRLETQLGLLNSKADLNGVQEVSTGLGRSLRELREAIMRVRLIPVAEIFARMPFVVRDLSRQTQKKVRLKLAGESTEIDKYLIERLKDPLLHLVRNAFSHGVETPAERIAASKPEEATIELSASAAGDSVVIEVRDDGRGINPNRILQRARKLGLETPESLDNDSLLKILCSSGFSTRDDADLTSGRGVGMAVVYTTVRELGGNLTLESEEGRGTCFCIRLPLTLAIAETLIVSAAGQTCAVPQSFVREILQKTEADVQIANGIEIIPYREGVLPVIRLSDFLGLDGNPNAKMYLLVIVSDRGSVGLLVEKLIGQREVVVRALQDPLIQVRGVAGATELGDGKAILILDGTALTSGMVRPPERLRLERERMEAEVQTV
ncbi:MAG TPA: chemotaxis protein CheA [Verrucomicrobiae bacterium]|nr:chemotaxis protein CheA [Verrucomicrobiae bacterium]